jgi:hypothetical protein
MSVQRSNIMPTSMNRSISISNKVCQTFSYIHD